jgi:hypothetical protein
MNKDKVYILNSVLDANFEPINNWYLDNKHEGRCYLQYIDRGKFVSIDTSLLRTQPSSFEILSLKNGFFEHTGQVVALLKSQVIELDKEYVKAENNFFKRYKIV